MYANDHAGHLLETGVLGGGDRHAQLCFAAQDIMPKCWNAEAISPYVSGIRYLNKAAHQLEVSGIWWCPSAIRPSKEELQQEVTSWGGFFHSYSYFGRVENWAAMATRPQELTENVLKAERLLMGDDLFHWWANDAWSYNHGINGARSADPSKNTGLDVGSPRSMAGLNQLFGDGRVVWRTGRSLNKFTLSVTDPAAGYVKGYATDASFY